jgi:hypothetical protein
MLTLFQQAGSGRIVSLPATFMPKIDFPHSKNSISRIYHDRKKIFSRSVLASSENFTLVNEGIVAQRLIEGETR